MFNPKENKLLNFGVERLGIDVSRRAKVGGSKVFMSLENMMINII